MGDLKPPRHTPTLHKWQVLAFRPDSDIGGLKFSAAQRPRDAVVCYSSKRSYPRVAKNDRLTSGAHEKVKEQFAGAFRFGIA